MNKRLVDEQARKIFERAERQENEFGEYFTGNLLLRLSQFKENRKTCFLKTYNH